jgi:peptide/nickel transport system substrate-binding protein
MTGLEVVPSELAANKNIQKYSTPLTTSVMAFYNTSHSGLNDVQMRKMLTEGVDRDQISHLFDPPVKVMNSPFFSGQLGYSPTTIEPSYDLAAANQALDSMGWTRDGTGIRVKDGKPLTFTIASQDTPSYTKVAQFLQRQWGALGVKINVNYYDSSELQTSIIANHDYDILLYGINIGVDPDEYAYWDSSQASITSQTRSNLSEYKSSVADQAIEAGRTRSDPAVRAIKYSAFLQQWTNDVPALALYQPNYLYITQGPVFNYERKANNVAADRFYNVDNWMIRQQRKNNPK